MLLDEAQHLTDETLEGIRLLSNIETAGDKLVQTVLAGQPELSAKLDEPSLATLKQRITFECRLNRLRYEEIGAYIDYRLSVAGYRGPDLFGSDAVEAIGFYRVGGVPVSPHHRWRGCSVRHPRAGRIAGRRRRGGTDEPESGVNG